MQIHIYIVLRNFLYFWVNIIQYPLLIIIRMGKNLLLAGQFQGFLEEIPKGPNQSYFCEIGQGPTKLNEEIVSQENVELLSKVRPVL